MVETRLRSLMLMTAELEADENLDNPEDLTANRPVILPARTKDPQHVIDGETVSDTGHDRPPSTRASRLHESPGGPGLVSAEPGGPPSPGKPGLESERRGIRDRSSGRAAWRSASLEETTRTKPLRRPQIAGAA
jgi:hypothetical protein